MFHWETQNATNGWDLGVYTNLPDFQAATGQESHGQVADPQFVATPGLGGFERGEYGPLPFTDFLKVDSRGADLRLQPQPLPRRRHRDPRHPMRISARGAGCWGVAGPGTVISVRLSVVGSNRMGRLIVNDNA